MPAVNVAIRVVLFLLRRRTTGALVEKEIVDLFLDRTRKLVNDYTGFQDFLVYNTCGGGAGLCRGAVQLCHVAPREEYIASTPSVYATSAPVAEYMRRRQPDRGASASGRVHSAGAITATAPLDEYVAQHWSRSRRKHNGQVSCGSASPCTMDFCENAKQWSERPIRQVAANSETIFLASVDSGSSHTNGLFPWSRGAFHLSRLASSPWVTAVDATRFVDQQPGQEEMAADQFYSGGGFSKMFDAFPHERLW